MSRISFQEKMLWAQLAGMVVVVVFFTLRSVTRSAAWRSVRTDMSSTSLCRAGSEGVVADADTGCDGDGGDGGGDGGGGVDADGDVGAVVSARTRRAVEAPPPRAKALCARLSERAARERTRAGLRTIVAWRWCGEREGNEPPLSQLVPS